VRRCTVEFQVCSHTGYEHDADDACAQSRGRTPTTVTESSRRGP
jgi:hypothetical protein